MGSKHIQISYLRFLNLQIYATTDPMGTRKLLRRHHEIPTRVLLLTATSAVRKFMPHAGDTLNSLATLVPSAVIRLVGFVFA